MRPGKLLDPAARLRLEAAVLEAERDTAGEIVVVVARACDEYGSAGWRLGVSLAALVFAAPDFLLLDEEANRWHKFDDEDDLWANVEDCNDRDFVRAVARELGRRIRIQL